MFERFCMNKNVLILINWFKKKLKVTPIFFSRITYSTRKEIISKAIQPIEVADIKRGFKRYKELSTNIFEDKKFDLYNNFYVYKSF